MAQSRSNVLRNGCLVFILAVILSFGFTFLKYRYDPSTVLRDDGINEFTPYLIERGRLIAQGDWSVLTTNSLSGGNLLVDFGRSIFHPIIVALTLVATIIRQPLKLAMLFGSLEMLSLITGGYLLGRILRVRPLMAMLLGVTLAFLPLNVALFTADHWNTGLGLSSFVWALAFAMRAFRRPSAARLLAVAASSWVVFSTGWPFAYLVLALVLIVLAIIHCVPSFGSDGPLAVRLRDVLRIAMSVTLAFVAASPVFSEYVFLMPGLARSGSGINNADNFGVPSLGQVLSIGNPVGGDWWNTFWGYVYWGIPIGFVTMLVFALFFKRFVCNRLINPDMTFAATMAVLMFIGTQLPTYVGPLRWTFRYLPYLAVFVAMLVFMAIDRLEWRWTLGRAWAAALTMSVGLLVLASRTPHPGASPARTIVPPLVALVVLVVSIALIKSRKTMAAILCLALGGTALASFASVTTKDSFVQTLNMPSQTTLEPYADQLGKGFVLTVESDVPRGGAANLLTNYNYGTRYLLFGQRVVNGYDPVGQAAYQTALKPTTSQGNLPNDAIAHLAQPVEDAGSPTSCLFDQYGIRTVLLQSSGGQAVAEQLIACGFSKVDGNEIEAMYVRDGLPALDGTASLADEGLSFQSDDVIDQQHETVAVSNTSDTVKTLHFARMYWSGYSATLNGRPLTVSPSKDGVLVDVSIPAGASGTLTLSYQPVTWRVAVPLAVAAAAVLAATLAAIACSDAHRNKFGSSAAPTHSEER